MKKIVLIEDSKVLGTALVGALKVEGIETYWAQNGVMGVTLAKQQKPDLILLDLCKLLKTDNITWRIPIVIMSTLTDAESRERAKEAGADHFIPKPYNLPETLAEIKKILKI